MASRALFCRTCDVYVMVYGFESFHAKIHRILCEELGFRAEPDLPHCEYAAERILEQIRSENGHEAPRSYKETWQTRPEREDQCGAHESHTYLSDPTSQPFDNVGVTRPVNHATNANGAENCKNRKGPQENEEKIEASLRWRNNLVPQFHSYIQSLLQVFSLTTWIDSNAPVLGLVEYLKNRLEEELNLRIMNDSAGLERLEELTLRYEPQIAGRNILNDEHIRRRVLSYLPLIDHLNILLTCRLYYYQHIYEGCLTYQRGPTTFDWPSGDSLRTSDEDLPTFWTSPPPVPHQEDGGSLDAHHKKRETPRLSNGFVNFTTSGIHLSLNKRLAADPTYLKPDGSVSEICTNELISCEEPHVHGGKTKEQNFVSDQFSPSREEETHTLHRRADPILVSARGSNEWISVGGMLEPRLSESRGATTRCRPEDDKQVHFASASYYEKLTLVMQFCFSHAFGSKIGTSLPAEVRKQNVDSKTQASFPLSPTNEGLNPPFQRSVGKDERKGFRKRGATSQSGVSKTFKPGSLQPRESHSNESRSEPNNVAADCSIVGRREGNLKVLGASCRPFGCKEYSEGKEVLYHGENDFPDKGSYMTCKLTTEQLREVFKVHTSGEFLTNYMRPLVKKLKKIELGVTLCFDELEPILFRVFLNPRLTTLSNDRSEPRDHSNGRLSVEKDFTISRTRNTIEGVSNNAFQKIQSDPRDNVHVEKTEDSFVKTKKLVKSGSRDVGMGRSMQFEGDVGIKGSSNIPGDIEAGTSIQTELCRKVRTLLRPIWSEDIGVIERDGLILERKNNPESRSGVTEVVQTSMVEEIIVHGYDRDSLGSAIDSGKGRNPRVANGRRSPCSIKLDRKNRRGLRIDDRESVCGAQRTDTIGEDETGIAINRQNSGFTSQISKETCTKNHQCLFAPRSSSSAHPLWLSGEDIVDLLRTHQNLGKLSICFNIFSYFDVFPLSSFIMPKNVSFFSQSLRSLTLHQVSKATFQVSEALWLPFLEELKISFVQIDEKSHNLGHVLVSSPLLRSLCLHTNGEDDMVEVDSCRLVATSLRSYAHLAENLWTREFASAKFRVPQDVPHNSPLRANSGESYEDAKICGSSDLTSYRNGSCLKTSSQTVTPTPRILGAATQIPPLPVSDSLENTPISLNIAVLQVNKILLVDQANLIRTIIPKLKVLKLSGCGCETKQGMELLKNLVGSLDSLAEIHQYTGAEDRKKVQTKLEEAVGLRSLHQTSCTIHTDTSQTFFV